MKNPKGNQLFILKYMEIFVFTHVPQILLIRLVNAVMFPTKDTNSTTCCQVVIDFEGGYGNLIYWSYD